jgi:SH3-like domain-containing protein
MFGIVVSMAVGAAAYAQPAGSGLPLPRFASLAAEPINVRTGPGRQYPIRWVYSRPGLPVKIVAEFDTWRQIVDHEGDEGWVHVSLLSGRQMVMIQGETTALRRLPDPGSRIVLHAEPGVIGHLVGCEQDWCQVEIAESLAWSERSALWGVLPDESPP